jgi:hypothetical protein
MGLKGFRSVAHGGPSPVDYGDGRPPWQMPTVTRHKEPDTHIPCQECKGAHAPFPHFIVYNTTLRILRAEIEVRQPQFICCAICGCWVGAISRPNCRCRADCHSWSGRLDAVA